MFFSREQLSPSLKLLEPQPPCNPLLQISLSPPERDDLLLGPLALGFVVAVPLPQLVVQPPIDLSLQLLPLPLLEPPLHEPLPLLPDPLPQPRLPLQKVDKVLFARVLGRLQAKVGGVGDGDLAGEPDEVGLQLPPHLCLLSLPHRIVLLGPLSKAGHLGVGSGGRLDGEVVGGVELPVEGKDLVSQLNWNSSQGREAVSVGGHWEEGARGGEGGEEHQHGQHARRRQHHGRNQREGHAGVELLGWTHPHDN